MKPVTIYTTRTCGFCRMAKALLTRKGAAFQEVDVTFDDARRAEMIAKQKGLSHPVIDATVALVDARLEANRKKAA